SGFWISAFRRPDLRISRHPWRSVSLSGTKPAVAPPCPMEPLAAGKSGRPGSRNEGAGRVGERRSRTHRSQRAELPEHVAPGLLFAHRAQLARVVTKRDAALPGHEVP